MGVEADHNGDGLHTAYTVDNGFATRSTAIFDDTFGSADEIIGELADEINPDIDQNSALGETENSYVRLAWETGGVAWDVGVIDTVSIDNGGPLPDQAQREAVLRDAFAEKLASQIIVASAAGKVALATQVIAAVNFGGAAVSGAFLADPDSGFTAVVQSAGIPFQPNDLSNAVPSEITERVFREVRRGAVNQTLILSVATQLTGASLPNGIYVVELLFNAPNSDVLADEYDLFFEGAATPVLQDYSLESDRTVIGDSSSPELSVSETPIRTKVVKRFEVQLNGGNGLQLSLVPSSNSRASIAGVRVLAKVPDLLGDYSRNREVDAADYGVWRDTLGATVAPYSGADGSGNGIIGPEDYSIWANNFGTITGMVMADLDNDKRVTMADYNVWKASEIANDLAGDINLDGEVDGDDLQIWRDVFGSSLGNAQFGLLDAAYGADVPPEVVGFMLAAGPGNTYDFSTTVGTGQQIKTAPIGGADKISITFNQPVTAAQTALVLVNLDAVTAQNPTGLVSSTSFAYEPNAQTATWTFGAPLADGRYLVRLSDSVVNVDNEALDGEFTNPWSIAQTKSSTFPSGDGVAGGEFRFRFTMLAGDILQRDNIDGTTNYTNWQVTEPGMIYASNTTDEFDTDLSFGDVSLREAVNYANTQGTPIRIELPAGRFSLTRNGTEATPTDVAFNDLDVTGNVQIVGAGPGLTIIDKTALNYGAFEVSGSGKQLKLAQLTVANGSSASSAHVAWVTSGASMQIEDVALVNHTSYVNGTAISVTSGSLSILRSVFSNNDVTSNYGGAAVLVSGTTTAPASVTVGESIFAQNVQPGYYGGTTRNGVKVSGTVTKTNLGKNLFDSAAGGFFDVATNSTDYLGTPTYVVMSIADTFNHADDIEALSLREAVDLANTTAGTQEIWLPAWKFSLTRDRATYGGGSLTDLDTAFGDLDVKDSLIVRGVTGRTSVAWKANVIDEVFDLLGDYNNNGEADAGAVSSADYTLWQDQNGLVGLPEQFSADGDDDGDVDQADYNLWSQYFGKTLQTIGVSLPGGVS